MLSDFIRIGQVLKPQGIKGAVKVRPETDDPDRFLDLRSVYLQEGEGYRKAGVEDVSVRNAHVYLFLDGSKSRAQAETQRDLCLFVARKDAVALPEGRYFICELIGCDVVDEDGEKLGVLRDILSSGASDVYVLDTPRGRLMFPAVPHVVLQVDIPQQLVTVDRKALQEVSVLED